MKPTGRPRLPITEEQIREVWKSREKLECAAARLGCCVGTISYRMRIAGLKPHFPERGRRFTAEKRQQVIEAIKAGEPSQSIADRLDLHQTTVDKYRRQVSGKRRNVYRWDRERLKRACSLGMSLSEIVAQMGIPEATVRHALKRFGLSYRRENNRKPIDRAAFIRDYRDGMSFSEMARQHGFSGPGAVKKRIGIEIGQKQQAVAS